MSQDVTTQVAWDWADGECLPLLKCVCGAEYGPWDVIINTEEKDASPMPCCGAKLYWVPTLQVRLAE